MTSDNNELRVEVSNTYWMMTFLIVDTFLQFEIDVEISFSFSQLYNNELNMQKCKYMRYVRCILDEILKSLPLCEGIVI